MPSKPQFVGKYELVKLSDIAIIKAGNVAPKKDTFTEDGVPFVRAGSLMNLLAGGSLADLEKIDNSTAQKLRLTLFPAGTVVFAKSGMSCMTGNVYVLPQPCYVVSHLACVIPNGNYASYLKHYFRFDRPNRLIENPSFPSIKLSKIQGIELRLPSSEEVVRQVQSLEHIESQIERAKTLLTRLDSLVKSRFVEMFGDPLGNPKGWRCSSLKEVAPIKGDPIPDGREVWLLGLDAIEAGTGTILRKETANADNLKPSSIGFSARHVLYSKLRPYLNKVVLPEDKGVCTTELLPLAPNQTELHRVYLCHLLRSNSFVSFISSHTNGAKMPRADMSILRGFSVPIPPLDLQQEFAAFASQVDKSRFFFLGGERN